MNLLVFMFMFWMSLLLLFIFFFKLYNFVIKFNKFNFVSNKKFDDLIFSISKHSLYVFTIKYCVDIDLIILYSPKWYKMYFFSIKSKMINIIYMFMFFFLSACIQDNYFTPKWFMCLVCILVFCMLMLMLYLINYFFYMKPNFNKYCCDTSLNDMGMGCKVVNKYFTVQKFAFGYLLFKNLFIYFITFLFIFMLLIVFALLVMLYMM